MSLPIEPPTGGQPVPSGYYAQPVQYTKAISNPPATWSLISGLVSFFFGGIWVWLLLGWWTAPVTIAAVVLGHIGLSLAQRRQKVGQIQSIVGLCLGYLGALNLAVYVLVAIAGVVGGSVSG
ncbi:MAG: hypothetical protein ACFCVG_16905 [Kineosporiaceae bacterium]